MPQKAQIIKLQQSVADFYETYGSAFSDTRGRGWNVMRRVLEATKPGMTAVDVGGGNGRLADGLDSSVDYVLVEPSSTLRAAAEERLRARPKTKILAGGFPVVPVEDAVADVTACFAVLHHVPTRAAQRNALKELARITKSGGLVCVTVWNLRTRRMLRSRLSWKNFLAAWLRFPMVAGGESGDVWFPWKANGVFAQRFVHAFTLNELKRLFDAQDWNVTEAGEEKGNLFVVATRR